MEDLIMICSCITAIILCIVGVLKLPFGKFKEKHPDAYKATFTSVATILTIVSCVAVQYLLMPDSDVLIILLVGTFAGVFSLYNLYEGLGIKALMKVTFEKLKSLAKVAPESQFTKLIDKIGIDKVIEVLSGIKEKGEVKPVDQAEQKEEVVENKTTDANTQN